LISGSSLVVIFQKCFVLHRKKVPVPGTFYILVIRDAPDTVFAGYPANPKAGYWISGRISGKGRIPDIRPDT
jgi:hypothetical protein